MSHSDCCHEHELEQIYFYLTEGCNLTCRHCWLSPKHQTKTKSYPVLPVDLMQHILKQAVPLGLKAVKLTGGEPLMHPGIKEILKLIKNMDISLTIETNGILCTRELAEEIAACNSSLVSVSLDGAHAETHEWVRGINGCFDQAVQGIKNLVGAGINPQIIFTVMKRNKHQLEDIVRLADSLGAGSVKFNIIQPTGRGETLDEAGNSLPITEILELGKFVNSLPTSKPLTLHYDLPVAFRSLSRMFGTNGDGCSTCGILKIVGVLANGSYALCGIGSHIPDLIFGHAATDNLDEIWKNNKILMELRHGIPSRFSGVCSRCHMKRICSASCIAQNYYRSNSLWSPYWFCEQAHSQGLFPKTRLAE